MRFPIEPIEPPGPTEDLYEIQQVSGIQPLRPTGARPRPPEAPPRYTPPPERDADEDTRTHADRRQQERRQYTQPVLVDTRLGRDRRHARRRPNDPPPPSIDEEA